MNKFVVVDVGNTAIKASVVDEESHLGPVLRGATVDVQSMADQISDLGLDVALSCVRVGSAEVIRAALQKAGKRIFFEVNGDVQTPVYGFYKGMGADRVADMTAAFSLFQSSPRPVAVVGLGTATAITAVSAKGKFVGAYTTLGLGSVCQALSSAVPALPAIDPASITSLDPGENVYDALARGTVLGHVGLIERWIESLQHKLGAELSVVATGGWSSLVGSLSKSVHRVEPELTLRGISILASSAVRTNQIN